MAGTELTQAEAQALIDMEKRRVDETRYRTPHIVGKVEIPLVSADEAERFILDLNRRRIDLRKVTYQSRARVAVVLVRLDLGGGVHRNPDDAEIACPHLHVYREGCGTQWAVPVPPNRFRDLPDLWKSFEDFMAYCNITKPPRVEKGLFS